jgi:hypothetical protein
MAAKKTGSAGFNFGNLSGYSAGGGLPEGDYCLNNVHIKMHQSIDPQGVKRGDARLSVMITFIPLTGDGDEVEKAYSLGSKAHLSWVPRADGKGIEPVVGGPGTPPNNGTNWALFVKSLLDSGMPEDVLKDDVSALSGTWVHMQNVPEPEERKGFAQAATGEAGQDTRPKTVAIVSEIKENGKPWEGTGGVPAGNLGKGTARNVDTASLGKANGSPATPKGAVAKPVTTSSPSEGEDPLEAAQAAITEVLEKKPEGMNKLMLKTSTFKVVNENFGQDMAQKVTNEVFGNEKALGAVLGAIGYRLDGANVKPV